MVRAAAAVAFALALAACNPAAPNGATTDASQSGDGATQASAGERAPPHASQSQATSSGPVRQLQITDENRRMVEQNVRDMLGQLIAQVAPGGTAIPGVDDAVTAIQPGADYQYPVNLRAGVGYSFVAVCDADCDNIDLELLDGATGAVVGADLLEDDFPVVHYRPQTDARYFVRLILRTCTQAPCYIGARGVQTAG